MTSARDTLVTGYKVFRSGDYTEQAKLYETLGTLGQTPKTLVISCSDSRVEPSDIFGAKPGDLFVVRNVANLVPPYDAAGGFNNVAAALQYAVTVLNVEMILVMGHEGCGGVAGCLSGMGYDAEAGHVGRWVSLLNGARQRVLERNSPDADMQFELELEGVRESVQNLMTYEFIRDAVKAGTLTLQAAHFGITEAELRMADDGHNFVVIESLT